MQSTWDTFKTKPATSSIYTDDAVVIYVPSGAGARGSAQIRRFFLQPSFKSTQIQEKVHATLFSKDRVMEELDWTVTFQGTECTWLVPTIDEGHLMNATIKLPVVVSAIFVDDKISTLRVYWDQASVLKQLRVISERNKWPVRGEETIDALRTPNLVALNPFAPNDDLAAPVSPPPSNKKKTYAIDAPGRAFGPVRPEDQVSQPIRKNLQGPGRNIFTYEPPQPRPLVSTKPDRLGSSFTLNHDEGTKSTTTPSASVSGRRMVPKQVNIFGGNFLDEDPNAALSSRTAHLSVSGSKE
ncbi:hypothetical protein BX666DRAFT_2026863 [Dichotomocladium elegans]|nr:hypothetical protein BX666DRAFT_2026863 [Dichotomocladium elegans]